ncbi:hypothetical protein [Edwardsiella piscicida]|uniref:hypothetical protein n=1 Tax=Edwardsiella piscicida TaxID=1263550 RepID=UPI002A5B34E9|nr:hypothetical protein [Edwardsiella piscicida]
MKENYFDSDLEPEASPLPELHPEPETEKSETQTKDNDQKAKRQFMGYDLSTLLIAGSVLVAMLAYAVWPDEPPTHAFIPDHQAAPAPVAPTVVEEAPAPEPEPLQLAEPVQPAAPPVDAQALQQVSEASKQGINALNSRVSEVERRLTVLEARIKAVEASPPPHASAANQPAKRAAVKSTTTRRTSTVRTGTVSQRSTGVQGWRVHTIYPGMAWITHGGSTWSVQAGDTLNGMSIRSINATTRTVTTDRGVIR